MGEGQEALEFSLYMLSYENLTVCEMKGTFLCDLDFWMGKFSLFWCAQLLEDEILELIRMNLYVTSYFHYNVVRIKRF